MRFCPGYFRKTIVFAGVLLVLPFTLLVQAVDITLANVEGVKAGADNRLACGGSVTLSLRLQNGLIWSVHSLENGFRIYTPDGGCWRPRMYVDTTIDVFPPPVSTIFDTTWYGRFLPLSDTMKSWTIEYGTFKWPIFDEGIAVQARSYDGREADTVVFSGLTGSQGLGIKPGFNETVWSITLDSISCPDLGESFTICLDSVNDLATRSWLWARQELLQEYSPTWGGAQCFEIHGDFDGDGYTDNLDNCPSEYNPLQEDTDGDGVGDVCTVCCQGMRGNCDNDATDLIDIMDLTFLVAFMFKNGPSPECEAEADINGLPAPIDILDLTYLVDFMFKNGPPPLPCSH